VGMECSGTSASKYVIHGLIDRLCLTMSLCMPLRLCPFILSTSECCPFRGRQNRPNQCEVQHRGWVLYVG
jgi:hypothetical protein